MRTKFNIILVFGIFYSSLTAQFNYKLKEIAVPFSKNSLPIFNALSGGLNYCNISKVDVNNDNKKDLVFFDKSDNKAHVYLNNNANGNIAYQYNSAYTDKFPSLAYFCILIDYNNDGKEDIFTSSSNGIIVYRNTSTTTSFSFTLATAQYGTIQTNYFPNTAGYPDGRMYNSGDGIPGIYDLDGDGDLEIFTFDIGGSTIDVHKNMSVEMYGNTDSLLYKRIDDCYGRFRETNCQSFSLYPASAQPSNATNKCDLTPFQFVKDKAELDNSRVQHAGASLLIFDPDKDGDADVLLGDISCDSVKYFTNTPLSGFNVMGSSTINFPNANDPAKIFQYPSAYYLDVDDDGKKDLLISPNKTQSENKNSIYLYKNYGVTINAKDSFELMTNAFLQEGSIDIGEQAHPVLYDLDKDGDLDLFIGSGFFIDGANNNLRASSVYYYQNIGTSLSPNFSFVTDDYLGLKSFGLTYIRPAFGDLDNDGDDDAVFGNFNGTLIAFKNTAAANLPPVLIPDVLKFPAVNFDVGNYSSPTIIDVNNDGLKDIISGKLSGKLSLLLQQANGTYTINQNWGALNFNTTTVPSVLKYNNVNYLCVGLGDGTMHLYDTIESVQNNTLKEINPNVFKNQSFFKGVSPAFGDLNNDTKPDLVVGNLRGGIYIFEGDTAKGLPVVVSIDYVYDKNISTNLYPNPAKEELFISNVLSEPKVFCTDMIGRQHSLNYKWDERNKTITIYVSNLVKGVYLLKCDTKSGNVLNKKVIIE
jgi:hypothetical protein